MKNLSKLAVVVLVIAASLTACGSNKEESTIKEIDSVKVDTAVKVDSGKTDTTVITTTTKKDSVKN